MRGKSSQKFTWVRLFEFYSSSVTTQQCPNAFGIALAAPSVLAKGKELPSAIIGAASAKDACIIIFLLFE